MLALPVSANAELTKTGRQVSRARIVLSSSSKIVVRALPDSSSAKVGSQKNGRLIRIRCQINGGIVSSSSGASRVWNRVKANNGKWGYVPSVYMDAPRFAVVASYCGWTEPTALPPAGTTQGPCFSYSPINLVPLSTPPTSTANFIATAGPHASASQKTTNVPASVTLAQGILESASGVATAGANNYFGIKAHPASSGNGIKTWSKYAVGCVLKTTLETEGGRSVRRIDAFRLYRGMRESFEDHGNFLVVNTRYSPAFKYSTDPKSFDAKQFVREVAKAGYATDPSYANSLIGLMDKYSLQTYDVKSTATQTSIKPTSAAGSGGATLSR